MSELPTACPGCGLNVRLHVSIGTPNAEIRYCPQCGEILGEGGDEVLEEMPDRVSDHFDRVRERLDEELDDGED